ncbi:YCF48-related protein [Bacteroidota bacterium]
MKPHLIILIYIIFFNNIYPQWQSINPDLTTSDLNDIEFIDHNTAYIVGNKGTIIKTTDGGSSWIFQSSPTNQDLTSASFYNSDIGYAVGRHVIIGTLNGGKFWDIALFNNEYWLNEVYTVNDNTVMAAGRMSSGLEGILLISDNKGAEWEKISLINYTYDLTNINFVDEEFGWGGAGKKILKTTDGGSTWDTYEFVFDTANGVEFFGVKDIHVFSKNIAWFLDGHHIVKTQDGGETWRTFYRPQLGARDITFVGYSTGWSCGGNGIWKTMDGGAYWEEKFSYRFNAIEFTDLNIGFAVGDNGNVVKSTNGGENWIYISDSFTNSNFSSVCFMDAESAWTVGGKKMFFTSDAGSTWTDKTIYDWLALSEVYFVNTTNGWAMGDTDFLRTTDGGETWVGQEAPWRGWQFISVCFIDENNGWVSDRHLWHQGGKDGRLFETTDGSKSWNEIKTRINSYNPIHSIYFKDLSNGIITEDEGYIEKTTDGSETWISQKISDNLLVDLFFLDDQTGFAVGMNGSIYKTTNFGDDWIDLSIDEDINLLDSYFFDDETGWLIGYSTFGEGTFGGHLGQILYTKDGGESWENRSINSHKEIILSVDFNINKDGIVVGENGTILNLTNDSLSTSINYEHEGSFDYQLSQNYPNPFNSFTTIAYSLPKEENVILCIFDILGSRIRVLVNSKQSAGSHKIVFDADNLSSGIYYYRIEAGKFNSTGKLLLMK